MHQSALSLLRRDQALNILLFLFPTLGAFTRHWISIFFWLISVTAIYILLKQSKERRVALSKDEWIVFAGMVLFFLACITSGLTQPFHVSTLEVEFKYLLFIPIYIVLRERPESMFWFLLGLMTSAFCIFCYALYEFLFLDIEAQKYRVLGAYTQNYFGAFAAITAFLSLAGLHTLPQRYKWLCIIAFILALVSAIASGSRGSYAMVLGTAFFWGMLKLKARTFIVFIAVVSLAAITVYKSADNVRFHVDRAFDDIVYYFTVDDLSQVHESKRSMSNRFIIWEHSIDMIWDHPWLGIGRKNFPHKVREYMTVEQRGDRTLRLDHAHNAFLEVLVSKGIVGLIGLVLIFFYPLYVFIRDYRVAPDSALLGLMFMIPLFIFSLNFVPFINNKETAIFVLLLAILLSNHLRGLKADAVVEAVESKREERIPGFSKTTLTDN